MLTQPNSPPERSFHLGTKPDAERCLARIEAWFHQAILDRVPVRFQHHNAQYAGQAERERARWASLEARWFDVDYQLDTFERALAERVFLGETFPLFMPNLGPNV